MGKNVGEQLVDVMSTLREARMRVNDCQRELEHLAWQARDMPLDLAIKLGIVKFNFAVSREFVRAFTENR